MFQKPKTLSVGSILLHSAATQWNVSRCVKAAAAGLPMGRMRLFPGSPGGSAHPGFVGKNKKSEEVEENKKGIYLGILLRGSCERG